MYLLQKIKMRQIEKLNKNMTKLKNKINYIKKHYVLILRENKRKDMYLNEKSYKFDKRYIIIK